MSTSNYRIFFVFLIEIFLSISTHGENVNYTIPDIKKCGTDFSCVRFDHFTEIDDCSADKCPYTLTYKSKKNLLEFYLSSSEGEFAAIGFSSDPSLSDMEIISCVKSDDEVRVKIYTISLEDDLELNEVWYANNKYLKVLYTNSDHGVHCAFTRVSIPWSTQVQNLLLKYYHVYMWGNIKDGAPLIAYNETKLLDWESTVPIRINLTDVLNVKNFVNTALTINNTACNASLSCVRVTKNHNSNCNGDDCVYKLSYLKSSRTRWPLFLSSCVSDYVAVGLTNDNETLANTEIMGCKKDKDNTITPFYYWISNSHQLKTPQKQKKGLKLVNGGIIDNGLWCSLEKIIPSNKIIQNLSNFQIYLWGSLSENGDPILPESTEILSSNRKITINSDLIDDFFTIDGSSKHELSLFTVIVCTILFLSLTIFLKQ